MSPAYTWQWDNMVGGWRGDEELVQGHPGTFRTSRNSPMYYSSNDTYLLYAPWPEKPDVAQEAPETVPHHSYADSVTSSFHSATTVATSSMGGILAFPKTRPKDEALRMDALSEPTLSGADWYFALGVMRTS
ncbi:DNAH12 [Symbiodinium natans]|uniref:DNAH12 protein n=1 Tax=Symbiodinium natans TaxID=878477 RepID=A0A812MVB6_9DINO|nr:DNAH12 [Symbiodinium natans]